MFFKDLASFNFLLFVARTVLPKSNDPGQIMNLISTIRFGILYIDQSLIGRGQK